jgi:hypothetical protein
MNLFAALRQRRQPAQGFGQVKAAPEADLHQTFILEPILTPSGLVDVGEDIPEVADLDIDLGLNTEPEDGFDPGEADFPEAEDLGGEDFEEIPFIENPQADSSDESSALIAEGTTHGKTSGHEHTPVSPIPNFDWGLFLVEESGEVSFDFLYDGGSYQGELGIFSLEGMEDYEAGSHEFIQEAARRTLSNSVLGHIAISDIDEGARFNGFLGESKNWNSGIYGGSKTFTMRPGDVFGLILVPDGTFTEVAEASEINHSLYPLFSLSIANPEDGLHIGQIVDINGEGNAFSMEDQRVDGSTDRDYNDLIFQIRGARGNALLLDDVAKADTDWRLTTDLGREIIDYITPQIDADTNFDLNWLLDDHNDHSHEAQSISADYQEIVSKQPKLTQKSFSALEASQERLELGNQENPTSSFDFIQDGGGTLAETTSSFDMNTLVNRDPWPNNKVTYSFLSDGAASSYASDITEYNQSYGTSYNVETVSELSETTKDNIRQVIEEILEPNLNIDFVEVSDSSDSFGEIRYMFSDGPNYAYSKNWPYFSVHGDIHLNPEYSNDSWNNWLGYGTHGYETIIHETLHSLGLKHPGNYNGSGTGTGPFLPFSQDHTTNTVMSYNTSGQKAVSMMPYDIKALQAMYGQRNIKTDNTVYSFQTIDGYSVSGKYFGRDNLRSIKQTILDTGGIDILNFSELGSDASYRFDLNDGGMLTTQLAFNSSKYSARGDNSGTIYRTTGLGTAIAFDSIIENLIVSPGNDEVIANTAVNVFSGYGAGRKVGHDVIRATDALDTLDLSAYRESEVTKNRIGNDLKISLGILGSVTIADYYSTNSRIKILWNEEPVFIPPNVSISVNDSIARETKSGEIKDSARFTISRSDNISKATTVHYSMDGTAKNGADYEYLSGSVIIPADQTSVTLSIDPKDDSFIEGTETVTVNLQPNSAYKLTDNTTATVSITDNDKVKPLISVSATDSYASERKSGESPNPGRFTVNRTGDISEQQVVYYAVSGTASNGSDYSKLSGSIIIPAGMSSTQIPIDVFDDGLVEPNETVVITLQSNDSYQVSSLAQTGSVTIYDNDFKSTITVTTTDSFASETFNNSDPARFTINRSGSDNSKSETIRYKVAGTADNGIDYALLLGEVTIEAGKDSAVININPIDDSEYEGTEGVTLTIESSDDYDLGSTVEASAQIQDDDSKPEIGIIKDVDAAETKPGEAPQQGRFVIYRTGSNNSQDQTVHYTISGTATDGQDYVIDKSTTIPAGEVFTYLDVTPIDDNDYTEGTETVIVTIKEDDAYALGDKISDTVRIFDNDEKPKSRINIVPIDGSAAETASGEAQNSGVFRITRTGGDNSKPETVYYTIQGSAENGLDYVSMTQSVTIPENENFADITVQPIDDSDFTEGTETVEVSIAQSSEYQIGASASALVVINDNDGQSLYDITFDQLGQEAGQVPISGASPLTISEIVSGTPTVEPYLGELSDQPLVFSNNQPSGTNQIRLDVKKGFDVYNLSFDIFVESFEDYLGGFKVLLDLPGVRNIYFRPNGTVALFPQGTIGSFDLNGVNHVETQMDLANDNWEVIVNDNTLYNGSFSYIGNNDDLHSVRFSLGGSSMQDIIGIDNIRLFGKNNDTGGAIGVTEISVRLI